MPSIRRLPGFIPSTILLREFCVVDEDRDATAGRERAIVPSRVEVGTDNRRPGGFGSDSSGAFGGGAASPASQDNKHELLSSRGAATHAGRSRRVDQYKTLH